MGGSHMAKQHDKQFAVQYYQDHKDLGVLLTSSAVTILPRFTDKVLLMFASMVNSCLAGRRCLPAGCYCI